MPAIMSLPEHPKKRYRSPSTFSRERPRKEHRHQVQHELPTTVGEFATSDGFTERKEQESFAREQTRRNQIQEAEQMREWVSKEDDFVLKQSKKKAHIRVREGRAKFIDWLAVTLSVIDKTKDPLEDETNDTEVDIVDPAGVFEGLNQSQLKELANDIGSYLTLETNEDNRRYWSASRPSSMKFPVLTAFRPSESSVETIKLSLPQAVPEVARTTPFPSMLTGCLAPNLWKSLPTYKLQSRRNWSLMSQLMSSIGSSYSVV